ncbi:MAG: glycoside hydrolase family 3 N-terminal domain-containing protein [bacterium]
MKGITLFVVYKTLYRTLHRKYRFLTRSTNKLLRISRKYTPILIRRMIVLLKKLHAYFSFSIAPPQWLINRRTSHAHLIVIRYTTLLATLFMGICIGIMLISARHIVEKATEVMSQVPRYLATPTPTPTPDVLAAMSPAQRIAQLLMVRIPGNQITDETAEFVSTLRPGGIILMRDNITDMAGTKSLVESLQSQLKPRALIAVDQEGGSVQRLPWDTNQNISGDHTEALRKIGANVNLAPVLDRAFPDGYIRARTYASESAMIITKATDMIEAQHAHHIASVGKHFPGIGRATEDPHARIPLITASQSELVDDMAPFSILAPQLDMIMSSHVIYTSVDYANPTTFSRILITGTLRQKMGYAGVIVTDDLNMDSIVGQKDKYVRALQAGHDLLLTLEPTSQVKLAFDEIAQATASGRLRMSDIDESVRRILAVKHRYGLVE